MKQFIILLFVLLSTTLWGQHNYRYNPEHPRAQWVQQNGNVRVQVIGEQPESLANKLSAIRTLWEITMPPTPSDFTFQLVNSKPDMIVNLKRKPNFTPTKPTYEISFYRGDSLSNTYQTVQFLWENGAEICYCKGKPLYGRVKVVDRNADFKIKVLDTGGYDVVITQNYKSKPAYRDYKPPITYRDYNLFPPKKCGEWLFVEHHPDFTVQIVDTNQDFIVNHEDFYGNMKSPLSNESLKGQRPFPEPAKEDSDPEDPEVDPRYPHPSRNTNRIENCHYKGRLLYGQVEVVTSNADFNVQVINHGTADLRVEITDSPSSCGQWKFISPGSTPDFTICYVESSADFTIEYVNMNPGQN